MTLKGTTASRFLLAAAKVVLTDDEYNKGYLPDFRGDKIGRVPIPQESVDKLKGANAYRLFHLSACSFVVEAVRMRFGYKEADMSSVWSTIRTSLVQKVSDVRKSEKRRSQNSQQRPSEKPCDVVSDKQEDAIASGASHEQQ